MRGEGSAREITLATGKEAREPKTHILLVVRLNHWATQSRDSVVVVVVLFFRLTDRASTIPSNIRGCQ